MPHFKATIAREISVTFDTLEAFRTKYPNAQITRIDGVSADAMCAKGHPHSSEYGCWECRQEAPCPECKRTNR